MPVPETTSLRRSLSLPLLTFYGLGNILGAGIYVLIGKVAGAAGLYAPVAFLLALLLALFTAFSYAELSARYPYSAGEAVYVHRGLGVRGLSLVVGLLLVFTGVFSAGTIIRGFVGYLQVFVVVPDAGAIVLTALALAAVAIWGIVQSARLALVLTVIEAVGLVIVLWVTRGALADVPAHAGELVPPADLQVWNGILLGSVLAFYAFIGFEDMVNVAEEVRDPARAMPWAIFLALATATVLYVLLALAAVLSVPAGELAASDAPLALLYERATGREPVLITVIGMFAVINGALIQVIMASRILYGLSRQGWLPSVLGRVHPRTRTPVTATVIVGGLTLGLTLWLPIQRLAENTSLLVLIVFALVNASLIRVKRNDPRPEGVTVFPVVWPVIGLLACSAFVLFELSNYIRH